MDVLVKAPEEIVETLVKRLPLSKSISARAMILAALTGGAEAIPADRLAVCDDVDVLAQALKVRTGSVNCGLSGTAMRFLTAFFAATPGSDVEITGEEALRCRPLGPLVDALRQMGASIEYMENDGHLPVRVKGCRLAGGHVRLDASASSQFASALALIAPTLDAALRLDLGGEIASMPYFNMTLEMLDRRGVEHEREGYTFIINNSPLKPVEAECEPDWSAASYWYAIAAVTAGWVTLPRFENHSIQGDSVLAKIGDRIGVISEFDEDGLQLSATPDLHARLDMDMADYPDLVPSLAVAAAVLSMPFHFTGLENLRHKESDRLEALCSMMRRCGWVVTTDGSSLLSDAAIEPIFEQPVIDASGDHRIAMAFAAAAMWVQPGIIIRGAECVSKSYPGFWDDLRDAGFEVEEIEA